MAGLQLMAGTSVTAAMPPSSAGATTIAQQAYGVNSGMDSQQPKVAGFGCLSGATVGVLVLAWLWWTLPR